MCHDHSVLVKLQVRPGSRVEEVGGAYGGALVVRVTARPEKGRATEAALAAVARAFGVPRGAVTLRSGSASRTKLVEVSGATPDRLQALLADAQFSPRPTAPARGRPDRRE